MKARKMTIKQLRKRRDEIIDLIADEKAEDKDRDELEEIEKEIHAHDCSA